MEMAFNCFSRYGVTKPKLVLSGPRYLSSFTADALNMNRQRHTPITIIFPTRLTLPFRARQCRVRAAGAAGQGLNRGEGPLEGGRFLLFDRPHYAGLERYGQVGCRRPSSGGARWSCLGLWRQVARCANPLRRARARFLPFASLQIQTRHLSARDGRVGHEALVRHHKTNHRSRGGGEIDIPVGSEF